MMWCRTSAECPGDVIVCKSHCSSPRLLEPPEHRKEHGLSSPYLTLLLWAVPDDTLRPKSAPGHGVQVLHLFRNRTKGGWHYCLPRPESHRSPQIILVHEQPLVGSLQSCLPAGSGSFSAVARPRLGF